MSVTLTTDDIAVAPIRHWAVMRRHAKTFSWAARAFPPDIRHDTSVLYAFARFADDIADEASMGTSTAERAEQLSHIQAQLAGHAPASSQVNELMEMIQRRGLPAAPLRCFLDTLVLDLSGVLVPEERTLFRYAHGVAGCVGLAMRPLLGGPASADKAAVALGIAMQLTNIARDVAQDWQMGRLYVPGNWLGGALRSNINRSSSAESFVPVHTIHALIAQAEILYQEGLSGVSELHPECQRAIRIAAVLYREIGRNILRTSPRQYWKQRVVVGPFQKLRLTLASSARTFDHRQEIETRLGPQEIESPRVMSAGEVFACLDGLPGFESMG